MMSLLKFLSSRGWSVLIVALLNFGSFFILFSLESRFEALTGSPAYDTQNDLTSAGLLEQLHLYQGDALQAYYVFAVYDFVFPLIAALFVAVLLTWLLRQNPTRLAQRLLQWKLPVFAFLVTAFDWLENVCLLTIVSTGRDVTPIWIDAAIFFKRLKLAGLTITSSTVLLILFFTIITRLYFAWRTRSQASQKPLEA